uniref:Uncharacterized protein n=1 Tax=Hippocampus comes TaxID=109280 RepID=A0A3Q3D8U4_HIPCM
MLGGSAHGGTFAEQIITLVHSVKELYFKGNGITLNQRFSAPQRGDDGEEEPRGLTLNQRFSSNQYMLHGPGDLRHDLERRRQKRLEGVTITIQGGRHPPPTKDEYADGMLLDERDCRRDGNTVRPKARVARGRLAILNPACVRACVQGPRRGGPYRMNVRGTSRFKIGQPIRMQNRHSNDNGELKIASIPMPPVVKI